MRPSGGTVLSIVSQGGIGLVLPCDCPLAPGYGGLRFPPFEEAADPPALVSTRLHPLHPPFTSTPSPGFHQGCPPALAPRVRAAYLTSPGTTASATYSLLGHCGT